MDFKTAVDYLFGICLVANALVFVPQVVSLIKRKDSCGLSLLTYLGFNVIQFVTVLHGLTSKDYFLAFGFLCALFTSGTVTLLIIFYKCKNVKI